ncbi:fungal-specific transcription factor domain-containing protein [Lentinula boryana]|uniref:Fungal-specific transcription factor domain-containing protein n=1 Tax=Lentinula boryana TaxID=40481 RepID=A0ABQ8Q3G7_9AGAR|nr:fungal-specific transcription factor domain-containing protein [Lentinula boryana]
MGSKASRACDQCRARKIKCDNILQADTPCTKCVSANVQCTFTYLRKKRKPNIAMAQADQPLDSIHSLIKEILSSGSYTPPSDPVIVRDIIVSLAEYAQSLDDNLTRLRNAVMGGESSLTIAKSEQARSTPQPDTNILEEESASEDDDVDHEAFKRLSLGHSGVRHFGKSSNIRFIHKLMSKDNQSLDSRPFDIDLARFRRPEYWGLDAWKLRQETAVPAYVFPEIDLLWDLVRIYFTEVAPYFPLLHRPTFETAIVSGRHLLDPDFGAIVLAVCSIAARDSNDPRVFKHDTKITAGWQWFRQVRLVRPHFVEPTSVHELQLCCLAYVYLRNTNMIDSVWLLIGIGLRLAVDRGIHRLKPGKARTVENELYIRAFWMLRNADTMQGMTMGRPAAINSEDFDTDRPAECDDEYWGKTEHSEAFTQPDGKISVLGFFGQYSKLMDIAASVQRSIYCVHEVPGYKDDGLSSFERNRKKVMQHDSALNDWLTSLPEHLRWDPHQPDEIRLSQSAILYTTYYWIQLQVHKNFIIRQDSSNQHLFPSFTICANAARSTVRISQVSHRRSKIRHEILVNLAHGLSILNLILWRHKRGISPTPYADTKAVGSDVASAIEMLKADLNSQTAGRVADKLQAFISAEGLLSDLPTEVISRSKRTWEDEIDDDSVESNSGSQTNTSGLEDRILAGSRRASSYMESQKSIVDPGQASVLSIHNLQPPDRDDYNGVQTLHSSFMINEASFTSPVTLEDNTANLDVSGATAQISSANETHITSIDDRMQHDWDDFMKDVDEVLLAIGFS